MKADILILASQSEARRRLLARLGLVFEVRPSQVDEEAVAARVKNPRQLVRRLAELKAATVAEGIAMEKVASRAKASQRKLRAVVIGSDQLLVCGGQIFGKPYTVERACRQLAHFSGRSVSLFTAVAITGPSGSESFVHETKMTFRHLKRAEIRDYVAADQPLECSGSFKFEGRGIGLFSAVRTTDPSAIEGLPLMPLLERLRARLDARSLVAP